MKVAKIHISNILGIENLEITPGKVTKIEGRNGSGKTSALEAIKAALKGGHDATLLRKGSDVGEIVLVLQNGTRVIKTVTATESNTKVTNENGKMSKPMQFIGQLSDEISLNPIKFLECKPADRADFLLAAMPLEANTTEIGEIISPALNGQKVSIPAGHALKSVDSVYDQLFQHRQDINRTLKEKKATIEQLSASLPEKYQPADKIRFFIGEAEKVLECKKGALTEAQRELDKKRYALENEASKFYTEKTAAADQEYAEALAKITEKRDAAKREAKDAAQAMSNKALQDWAASKPEDPTIADTEQKISSGRQSLEEAVRIQNTADVVAKMQKEADGLTEKSDAHTAALDALITYKNGLLKNLPIDVEIKDGKVFRGGIPYETLNLAQQTQIAVDLAKIRAKDLGLIVLDGAESLDSATLAALEDAIAKTDLQAVMTFVRDTDLTVTTK